VSWNYLVDTQLIRMQRAGIAIRRIEMIFATVFMVLAWPLVLLWLTALAPDGWESDDGFHYGKEEEQ